MDSAGVAKLTAAVLVVLLMALACSGAHTADTPGLATSLVDTEWTLITLHGQPRLPGTEISLRFERDRFTGSAGCNHFGGSYVASDDGSISFPELERTLELCAEPEGVAEQEEAYIEVLTSATSFQLVDDRLELLSDEGEIILQYAWRSVGTSE